MPEYSHHSKDIKKTLHPDLQVVCDELIKRFDVRLISGWRGKEEQNRLYREGRSNLIWPQSKHNHVGERGGPCSKAVDMAPWPVDWENRHRFILMGGYVLGMADQLGIPLRWGGDWDTDMMMRDQRFNDLGHFELLR